MADAIVFAAEFAAAMLVAVVIERVGEWIGGLRSDGGGGMEPWRYRPMPPRPGPHGGAARDRRPPSSQPERETRLRPPGKR
jgi:hypothetical protein